MLIKPDGGSLYAVGERREPVVSRRGVRDPARGPLRAARASHAAAGRAAAPGPPAHLLAAGETSPEELLRAQG